MAMGEMVDRAASFWRARFWPLFKLYLPFQLAQYVLVKAYQLAIIAWLPLMRGGARTNEALQSNPTEVLRQMALGGAGAGGVMLLYFAVGWLAGVAGTRYVMPAFLGEEVSLGESARRLGKRAGTVIGSFLLSLLWCAGVGVGLMLPGLVLTVLAGAAMEPGPGAAALGVAGVLAVFFGLLVAALWYFLRFFLTAQVIAMEDLGAVASVRRSGRLVSGRVGPGVMNLVKMRATVLITVVVLILTAVSVIAGLPALILQFAYGKPFDPANADPYAVPQALLVPAELIQVIAQSAFGPLYVAFGVLFYLDMRVRREGLDLERRLEALGPRAAA